MRDFLHVYLGIVPRIGKSLPFLSAAEAACHPKEVEKRKSPIDPGQFWSEPSFPALAQNVFALGAKEICRHVAIGGHHDSITHADRALLALAYVGIERLWDQMALAERLIEQAELALSELHLSPTSLDVLRRY